MRRCVVLAAAMTATACGSGGSDGGTTTSGSSSSGSSSSGGEEQSKTLAALDAFCTTQTLVELKSQRWVGPQAWGTAQKLPAGSTIYLGYEFSRWEGFVITADDTPAKLERTDGEEALEVGTHITSTCTQPGNERLAVVMREMNLFADQALGGTPCKLPTGTLLPDWGYVRTGGVGSIHSPAIQTACGYEKGYGDDIAVAPLVKK